MTNLLTLTDEQIDNIVPLFIEVEINQYTDDCTTRYVAELKGDQLILHIKEFSHIEDLSVSMFMKNDEILFDQESSNKTYEKLNSHLALEKASRDKESFDKAKSILDKFN